MKLIIFAAIATVIFAAVIATVAVIIENKTGSSQSLAPYPRVSLTDHARIRFAERCGITDYKQMDILAANAFICGKTHDQLSGYESMKLHRKQYAQGDNYIAKLYQNHIYIFTDTNVLVTVYSKDYEAYH